jgi:P-type Ca2+ transporter type 2C
VEESQTGVAEARAPASSPTWHTLEEGAVLAMLSSSRTGLSQEVAGRRLTEHGPNELRQAESIRPLTLLLAQFKSLIVWILVAASLVSGIMSEWADCIAIVSIVVVNGLIGFYQEYSAERSLAALRRMTAPQARVRRDGRSLSIPAAEVVPGDVLELEAGDLVPADARVLEASALKTVEAALTGESEAVDKEVACLEREDVPLGDLRNMVFLGTSVAAGKGLALAVETGMGTEIGRIADLLAGAASEDKTPLQKRLDSFGRILVWGSLGIVGLIFVLGLVRGIPGLELFLTSVSLAVAAVPEGLPAVVTIALAVGVQRMAARRALVRKLHAVETLGSANVICTDKTGTLTVGEMTVRALWTAGTTYEVTGEGYGPEGTIRAEGSGLQPGPECPLREVLTVFVGCNGASLARQDGSWKVVGDPTEGALLTAGAKLGLGVADVEREIPRVAEIPFDSDRKRMTVIRRRPDGSFLALTKGAPDVLLGLCTRVRDTADLRAMTDEDRRTILAENAALAGRALRVLAAASRDLEPGCDPTSAAAVERDLVFLGLAGMYDPPRSEAKSAVALAKSAGIRVVMITGDHPHTALAVARELGIAGQEDIALSGIELDRLDDGSLDERVERVAVYARVTAAHKLRIVRAWKARGGVVAMTGDGVNDAPAIKGADIGIAMGRSGTEVTKEASDMVITDDNFASIVAAVEEGRGIYDNIKKTMQYLLAGNVGELLLMTACVLIGLPMPLLPIQLLWINLVTDGLPALCLATDPIDPTVMKRKPRRREEKLTDRGFVGLMIATGLLTSGVALAVYLYSLGRVSQEMARDHAFTALVYAELLRSFGARSETRSVWRVGLLSNLKLALVVLASMALTFWAPHNAWLGSFLKVEPMPVHHCLVLLVVGAIPLLVLEAWKLARHTKENAT